MKRIKKTAAVAAMGMFLGMMFAVASIVFQPHKIMAENGSWQVADNVTAIVDDDTITFSGTGIIPQGFSVHGAKKVIIQDGITAIGESAFRSCRGLTNVDIPNSVTSIGKAAFFYVEA